MLGACGTINPVLAPARVLGPGRVAADLGSGYSAPLVDGPLSAARDADARLARGEPSNGELEAALVRGAVAYGATPAGLSPYVAARVGLPERVEMHLALAGRAVRLGARRVFWTDDVWALSLGAQARVAPTAWGAAGAIPGLSVPNAQVYGGDLNAVIGRTSSGLYDVWLGLRTGYSHGVATLQLARVNSGNPFDASLDRLDVSATLGARVGFGHVAALLELEADMSVLIGRSAIGIEGTGVAFALIPAAAISWAF